MGASTEDMINQIQGTLATPPSPSLFGIQAPPDQAALRALLQRLQQQRAVQQTGNTPGEYGWLHDAGQKAFAQIGQSLGGAVGGALNAPGVMGNPAPPPDPRSAMTSAIQQAQQTYQKLVAGGADENVARTVATKQLVAAGVPGAADVLAAANKTGEESAFKKAETAKDTSQAAMDSDEIANRAFDQKSKTYTTTYKDPNGFFEIQTSGTNEDKRVELKPSNPGQQALANLSPQGLDYMVQTYKQTGVVPAGLARSPAVAGKFWDAVAHDPEVMADPNSPSAITANRLSNVSNGQALSQTQKQLSATTSYLDTMNKNIVKARELGGKLDLSDPVVLNQAWAKWAAKTSDPTYAKYNIFFDAITNEYAKIKSGSLGNTTVSDSARREARGVLEPLLSAGGMNAALDAVSQEGDNRITSLTSQRDDLVARLQGKHPVGPPQTPPPPAAAGKLPTYASEAEALAAGHQKGDKVIIGGVSGTLQ